MPTGYAGEGKTFSKKLGKWIKKENEKAFDYDLVNMRSAAFLVSFWRAYPDYFCDTFRSENARYGLELPQRFMMRVMVRFRNTYITGCRGLTKTYIVILTKMVEGILFPGEIMRYVAPNQKQAAALAAQAFHQIEIDYPIIAAHWKTKNDRSDMFRIVTDYGSQFTMYAPRGDNCSQTVAEEIGQEGSGTEAFDINEYERNILPICRIERTVNKKPDRNHINQKHTHISNACSKTNRAYSIHRAGVINDMIRGEMWEGFSCDISYVSAVICNLRSVAYIKDMQSKLTQSDWLREMCARYTGTDDDPMLTDEVLAASRRLKVAELRHCGDPAVIYVIAHDVSYVDTRKNAKCADVVLKLTQYDGIEKRDKYRADAVFVDNYPPPATDYEQAEKIYALWERFSLDGGEATYIVIDAQAYGTGVIEELMKPRADGKPPLCCYEHMGFTAIEQKNALPVIYPLKSGGVGTRDAEGDMIRYAQKEFEDGNVLLLIPGIYEGVEAYKRYNGIKDDKADGMIALPYKQTELLEQQIGNLRTKVSGKSVKEERKSKAIQRDIWSAMKYALRFKKLLEDLLVGENYAEKSGWDEYIASARIESGTPNANGTVNRLLAEYWRR